MNGTKLIPWHIAHVRDIYVAWVTIPLVVSETFFTTWTNVLFPSRESK